jgi:hypothetical protein
MGTTASEEPKLIFPGLAGFYASMSDLWYPMIRVGYVSGDGRRGLYRARTIHPRLHGLRRLNLGRSRDHSTASSACARPICGRRRVIDVRAPLGQALVQCIAQR